MAFKADSGHLIYFGVRLLLRVKPPFVIGAGVASMCFGLAYGEFFGPTHVVPTLWRAPLDEPTTLLVVAIGIGAALIAAAYALGTINRWREGGLARAALATAGLAGAALYLGLAVVAFGWYEHATVAMVAVHEQRVDAFYGAPQSVASHQFAARGERMGYFFEAPPLHPMLAALAMNAFGPAHRESMQQLAHTSAVIALCIDGFDPSESAGTVTLRPDGMPRLDYPFTPRLVEAARAALVDSARILLASGARVVRSLHSTPVVVRTEGDLPALAAAPFEPNRVSVFTAHQMGGCAMGRDPARSVVRSDLRHHEVENLFVVDGSVFPTSLGVNPQLSIYGLAGLAAPHVLAAAKA